MPGHDTNLIQIGRGLSLALLAWFAGTSAFAGESPPVAAPTTLNATDRQALEDLALRGTELRLIIAASLKNPVRGDEPASLAISQFLLHAIQLVDLHGHSATMGWWNPFDDAWVITTWTVQAGNWKLQRTAALLGSDLDSASSAGSAVPWDASALPGPLVAALWSNHLNRLRAYKLAERAGRLDTLIRDPDRQTRAWPTLLERQIRNDRALLAIEHRPGYQQLPALLKGSVANPSFPTLIAAGLKTRLAAFPKTGLRTMRAVMIARHPGGYTVLAQSPLAPALVVVARMRDPAGPAASPATVESLNAISLFATGAAP